MHRYAGIDGQDTGDTGNESFHADHDPGRFFGAIVGS